MGSPTFSSRTFHGQKKAATELIKTTRRWWKKTRPVFPRHLETSFHVDILLVISHDNSFMVGKPPHFVAHSPDKYT